MRYVLITLATAACTAAAFTPTHLVIVDSTPLYEKGHPFDEEYVLMDLNHWTGVMAVSPEPVIIWDGPHRGKYFFVTIKGGTEGAVNAYDLGLTWVATGEITPIYETSCPGEPIGNLKKDEIVAERIIGAPTIQYLLPIRTEQTLDGWVEYDTVEPMYVFPRPPHKKYGEPREGPPQNAGKKR